MLCGGVSLCAETAEKPYFKRFSGIEKAHRNSIKITVDFWRRVRDSNPRFLLGTQHFECCTFDHSDNSPYVKPEILKNTEDRTTGQNSKIFTFLN